jgi:hypothetical protein
MKESTFLLRRGQKEKSICSTFLLRADKKVKSRSVNFRFRRKLQNRRSRSFDTAAVGGLGAAARGLGARRAQL